VERIEETFTAIGSVAGDDGRPLVETRGVDSRECPAWRDVLSKIDEELIQPPRLASHSAVHWGDCDRIQTCMQKAAVPFELW
jgi:hypothetical protein